MVALLIKLSFSTYFSFDLNRSLSFWASWAALQFLYLFCTVANNCILFLPKQIWRQMIKYSLKVLFSGSVPLWSRLYLQPGHILNPQLVVEEFTFPQPFFSKLWKTKFLQSHQTWSSCTATPQYWSPGKRSVNLCILCVLLYNVHI